MCSSVLVEHPVGVVQSRLDLRVSDVQGVVFGKYLLHFGADRFAEICLGSESLPDSVDGGLVCRSIGSELIAFCFGGVQEDRLGL